MSHLADKPYLMAIDGGTESLRVGICDVEGHLVATAAQAYPTRFPRSGWAEQDPEDWWTALVAAVRCCFGKSGLAREAVAGICTDATTCTLLALDAGGAPLRPSLLWMDVRSSEQADRIFSLGHRAMQFSPSGCNAEWMLPKTLWIKENEPEIYRKTASIAEYQDWLIYRLTGRLVLNRCTASHRWYYNARDWRFPGDLYAALGLEDLAGKLPRDVLPAGERVGELPPAVAEELGLRASIPVFQGGGDAMVALLGTGVAEPGRMGLVAGSSNVVAGFVEKEMHGKGVYGAFPDVLIPGLWLIEAGQVSAGSVLAWFRRTFFPDRPSDGAFELLDREAADISPGSGGLVALEYFQGNRTPHTDSDARGALWGLALNATRAQIYRALMEGICFGLRHILDTLADLGCTAGRILACGGATRGHLYMQMIADACGLPITLTEVSEAGLLGGAIIAAAGLGFYPDIPVASRAMVRETRTFQPDPEAREQYQPFYELYRQTYPQLRGLMHRMARLQAGPVDTQRHAGQK